LDSVGSSYHGQPVLKAPVWTWEVPAYFFVGGLAGAAAVIAFIANAAGAPPGLARDARLVALAGALLSPPLLISDLGRPSRFLNMLRVFKVQSAMSLGAWTLVAFSAAITIAVLLRLTPVATAAPELAFAIDGLAAMWGLVLATYTGVLLAVTAVPVWAAHARTLPIHFGASSLGAAASTLELLGHREPALDRIALAAALVVLSSWILTERRRDPATAPVRAGSSATLVRTGDVLAGLLPVVLRAAGSAWPAFRVVAAASAVAGSLVTRFGWIAAGRASVTDPDVILRQGP
jgi:formate-dependent nitrite reductase membrane component NrfD